MCAKRLAGQLQHFTNGAVCHCSDGPLFRFPAPLLCLWLPVTLTFFSNPSNLSNHLTLTLFGYFLTFFRLFRFQNNGPSEQLALPPPATPMRSPNVTSLQIFCKDVQMSFAVLSLVWPGLYEDIVPGERFLKALNLPAKIHLRNVEVTAECSWINRPKLSLHNY